MMDALAWTRSPAGILDSNHAPKLVEHLEFL